MPDNRPNNAPQEQRAPEFRNQAPPSEAHATPDQSRQGPRGWPVLIVLIGGLILGAIYIISLLIYADTSSPPPPQGSLNSQPYLAEAPAGVLRLAALHPPGAKG